ncbi:MAG: hypothetical protein E3J71_00755 [Candidatus Stahlbacteria bacterium]|nr:MAG: hypothetical protein E3J71_00755 [Candidatus Stahlbacteria bacterium]
MKTLRRVIVFAVILKAFAVILPGPGQELQAGNIHRQVFDGEILPGEYVAFRWNGRRLLPWKVPEESLTKKARRAIAVSPAWLRSDLAAKLNNLSAETQDSLAGIILAETDPRLIDEIAFSIARLSARELTGRRFNPRIIAENARLIYEADSLFDYVELIDYGEPSRGGDWMSTARYRLEGGEGIQEYYELPCEVYYWYVVFPRLGREALAFIDPLTGEYAPPDSGGVFWRDYLMHEDTDPKRCASRHFVMEYPNLIEQVPASGEAAELVLTHFDIDPIPLIVDSEGSPLLCVFAWPGNQLDGQVIATPIPVELEEPDEGTGLFENLLRAGNASAMLDTAIVPEGFEDVRIAILKDRDPFGEPTIERALSSMGFRFRVFGSDEIAEMLFADSGFVKIIIPSGQPRSFYERLAESDSLWQVWMSTRELSPNRVIQFHGATDPAFPGDNWFGIRMPWGFDCALSETNELSITGYPRLKNLLSGTDYLWDNQPLNIPGDQALSRKASALEVIGYFVTQNLPDRCAEVPFYYRGADLDTTFEGDASEYVQSLRTPHPHRSLYLHYGNCGEMMNLLSASCRAGLVPVRNMIAHPVDHVWNGVYLEGRWRTYTAVRSDRGTRFDDGVYTRKNHYSVMGCRPDGFVTNCIADYFDSTFIAEVRVSDSAGRPVDGATVTIMTHWYHGDPPPKTHAGIGWTDLTGVARIEVGIRRDYFVQVFTPLIDWPELVQDTSERARKDTIPRTDPVLERRRGMRPEPIPLVSADADTIPGDTVRYNVTLPIALLKDQPDVDSDAVFTPGQAPRFFLQTPERILHGYSSYLGCNFTRAEPQGSVDLYVMDLPNYDRFVAGETFVPACAFEDTDSLKFSLPSLQDGWFVVLSNRHRMAYGQVVRLHVDTRGH